jgi:hypothetical protein
VNHMRSKTDGLSQSGQHVGGARTARSSATLIKPTMTLVKRNDLTYSVRIV